MSICLDEKTYGNEDTSWKPLSFVLTEVHLSHRDGIDTENNIVPAVSFASQLPTEANCNRRYGHP